MLTLKIILGYEIFKGEHRKKHLKMGKSNQWGKKH